MTFLNKIIPAYPSIFAPSLNFLAGYTALPRFMVSCPEFHLSGGSLVRTFQQ